MQSRISKRIVRGLAVTTLLCANVTVASPAQAQDPTNTVSSFSSEELGQIVAPIALYPDSLVSQILMASTYPLEVVQADRWAKSNEALDGTALEQALDKQKWDPSVKSLVNFPDVLNMMSVKLDWTTKLGDAFIGQQAEVLAAVQTLRSKAHDAGNLKSNVQQTVVVESSTQTIVIESSSPDVVYVPTYNPVVVYGTWPYPAYPPTYYHPPGYVATAAISFGVGVAVGAAWGYAWGDCHWGRGDVNINVNQNVNRNTNIRNTREFNSNRTRNNWQHDGSHRRGVSYRDQRTSERFGRGGSRDATRARENFRGRADRDRQSLSRDATGRAGRDRTQRSRDTTGRAGRDRTQRSRDSAGRAGRDRTQRSRDSAGRSNSRDRQGRSGSSANRRGGRDSAINRSGSSRSARDSSRRGSSSRSKSGRSSGSRSRSSGSRSRGGGGRRGGR
ncbi:MAG: DUF3300 domain-containing protein [Phycisphaerales bacterium]